MEANPNGMRPLLDEFDERLSALLMKCIMMALEGNSGARVVEVLKPHIMDLRAHVAEIGKESARQFADLLWAEGWPSEGGAK